MRKQKIEPIETMKINDRLATTVAGARKLLNQRAKTELRQERDYSRDAIYAMYRTGKIEGIRTPSANYYYLDSLKSVRLDPRSITKPSHYTKRVGKEGYPQEIKEKALKLYQEGYSKRSIASQLDISYQTVNNWIRIPK